MKKQKVQEELDNEETKGLGKIRWQRQQKEGGFWQQSRVGMV